VIALAFRFAAACGTTVEKLRPSALPDSGAIALRRAHLQPDARWDSRGACERLSRRRLRTCEVVAQHVAVVLAEPGLAGPDRKASRKSKVGSRKCRSALSRGLHVRVS
jgi:hypothetical protein